MANNIQPNGLRTMSFVNGEILFSKTKEKKHVFCSLCVNSFFLSLFLFFLEPDFHCGVLFSLTEIISSLFISYKTLHSPKEKEKVIRST